MTLKRTFDVTVTLLAPLHIGTGRELMRDYDYTVHDGKTWALNPDGILDAKVPVDAQGRFDDRALRVPPAALLEPGDFREDNHSLFRYVLPGGPRSQERGAVLREQIKDVLGEPYIPGSSLKGALRTVLAWHGFQQRGLTLDVGALGGSRSWAAQPLERSIFGHDPNHDLLRALQVADSRTAASERLRIVNAQVATGSEKMGAPIELEAIWTDTVLTTTITLDDYLHSNRAEPELRFGDRWQWLETLPEIARAWGAQHLESERDWFHKRNYDRIADLYAQMVDLLKRDRLGPRRFFVQVGWGGGWGEKTIGAPLRANKANFERLLGDKRLSPARFRRREGDPFPKSRRVVVQNGQPVSPFGWCLVEMKERKQS